jgi:hypothetical protein
MMTVEQPTPLTLFYTAALDGRIHLLPTLLTQLKRERAGVGISLLVDLGRSCAPGAWICDATEGRGMLVAMDGMGYDAFHIGPQDALYTRPALVQQLREVIATPLAAGPWVGRSTRRGLTFLFANAATNPASPALRADPADVLIRVALGSQPTGRLEAAWDGSQRVVMVEGALPPTPPTPPPSPISLTPAAAPAPAPASTSAALPPSPSPPLFARADLLVLPDAPFLELVSHMLLPILNDLPPDATMSGVIDFVESEARYALRKRGTPAT